VVTAEVLQLLLCNNCLPANALCVHDDDEIYGNKCVPNRIEPRRAGLAEHYPFYY
jgi:hypothetical protein